MPLTDTEVTDQVETEVDEEVLEDYEAPAVHIRASVCPENCY
jgi:hypothetical protein